MTTCARSILAALALISLSSCRRVDFGNPDGGAHDLAATSDTLGPDEMEAANEGNGAVPAFQQLAVLANTLFDFDPTLSPSQTDSQNAAAIEAHVNGAIGDAGTSCGAVSRFGTNGTILNIVFPAPGCTLPGGTTVSGSVSIAISKAGSTLSVALGFQNLVVNGKTLTGTATFNTTTGTSFSVDADLTTGTSTLSATALTVAGSAGVITIDGTASVTTNGVKTTLTFAALGWKLGECYPSAGTLKIKKGVVNLTLAFTSATPSTGEVTVTTLGKTVTMKLPAYGSCG